ncbi:MAG: hypothetical protein EX258_09920 [Sphingomonadaceae bacterium]|nr:MAG: hypothetical protein EX258_09920 [Sphingomonadaceae bacterium]
MRAIRNSLYGAGIPIECTKGEAWAGQEEINIRYADALTAADNHTIAKAATKEIAYAQGYAATFMAKYDYEAAGSSSHVHQSLWDSAGKKPLFLAKDAEHGMSETMRHYMAGLLTYASDVTAFLAPNINSYKRFQAGTNMRAWTFIILRNLFLSQMRRARFKGEWDDVTAAKILAAPAAQDKHVDLADMQRALMQLPQPQREALILVGAGGFAYEEAAQICGCAVGTIKSRVARGRVALENLLDSNELPSRRQDSAKDDRSALQAIMGEVDNLAKDT